MEGEQLPLPAVTLTNKAGDLRPGVGGVSADSDLGWGLCNLLKCVFPERMRGGGYSPEEGQILGELDDLLHHVSVDVCNVCEQRQHGDQGGQGLVMDEQISWRLWRSEREQEPPALGLCCRPCQTSLGRVLC